MEKKRLRNPSLDVVRIVALFLVITVHFFLNIGYYNVPMVGERLLLMTCLRTLAKACVPLFILLTGHLMHRKTLSGKYYLGIVKTLAVYVLASVLCILFQIHYQEQPVSLREGILGIFDFSAASYAWYVEMYIGLFLAIPFLNAMYHGMGTKKRKLALVATFLFLSSAYTVFNIFDLHTEGWWADPTSSLTFDELVPDYLIDVYPFTIYLIGAALSDFEVKLKRIPNLLLLMLVTVGLGGYSFYRSHGRNFVWGHWQGDRAVFVIAIAVLVFLFVVGFDMTRAPRWISKSLKVISDSVLGAYLVSYIFDRIFYEKLLAAVPELYQRYPYYFVIVPAVFVCSILTSMGINAVWWMISTPIGAAARTVVRMLPGRASRAQKKLSQQPVEEVQELNELKK